ncbi:sugar ABC transporter ATP-binding protein [Eubacterium sp. am_0171]|uniref:sugar ABC transporter ATP-binding protein n=1 Tax=unclassified Eubacterium (in: firmicutes) TaxID=2624479 RepID=UPI0010219510|nr:MULTISPECIES: sugar ABC transporter ATP-binding protein [unclassified Eubacterium (in: firmicutes)]MSC85278.1 ATP-binding cassette domain-containing protein [Eubacterium sp. BIOML-A1]MSD07756.1 ATP-binding cassette domain-containing protein [Eubacterium sp. BIOML-A2]RYT13957.1 sugar ABC transporter ATP-binding protein [Eubacterium sp. am_0171]
MKNKENVLKLEGINKSFFQVQVLKNISFEVRKGSVHALAGENGAGKSTLMKIVTGLLKADSGNIVFDNEQITLNNAREALGLGISMIHQELTPLRQMTIAENYFLGRELCLSNGLLNQKKMNEETQKSLNDFGMKVQATQKVDKLTIAQIQMLEIIKAVRDNSKLIIMDEPSSSLTEEETRHLFHIIRDLQKKGVAIIYISHRMEDIYEIADTVTVLRDGNLIGTYPIEEINKDKLIELMVNRTMESMFSKGHTSIGAVGFEVKDLSRDGVFKNISFQVHKGEILGITGLMGAGRTEVARAIFGLDKLDGGEIYIDGKKIVIRNPYDAISHGIVMLSEDRKEYGLVLGRSIRENISLPNLKKITRHCLLKKTQEKERVGELIKMLTIKCNSMEQTAQTLSGGNQQKVIIAKWLLAGPEVLILDEPTRGIDVGAKAEIYKLMDKMAQEGMTIIMISSELPEILSMSDRVMIMGAGEIRGEFTYKEFMEGKITQKQILEKSMCE